MIADTIIAECPDVQRTSGAERLSVIREWIYANTVVSTATRLLDSGTAPARDATAESELSLMREGIGGFFCGGIARFAEKVYSELGIPAYTVNFGIRETSATHVLNIVPFEDASGRRVHAVQDCYLNYTLTDQGGLPLDLLDIVARLKTGRRETVVSRVSSGRRAVLIPADAEDLHPFFHDAARTALRSRVLIDGAVMHWTPIMRPELFERAAYFRSQYQDPLREAFGDVSVLNLLRCPLSTSGQREIEEVVSGI